MTSGKKYLLIFSPHQYMSVIQIQLIILVVSSFSAYVDWKSLKDDILCVREPFTFIEVEETFLF